MDNIIIVMADEIIDEAIIIRGDEDLAIKMFLEICEESEQNGLAPDEKENIIESGYHSNIDGKIVYFIGKPKIIKKEGSR